MDATLEQLVTELFQSAVKLAQQAQELNTLRAALKEALNKDDGPGE